MAVVTYNQITLPYAFTSEFIEEPVRDQESDTDWHLTRYTVGVQTVIHADYLNQLASGFFDSGGQPLSTNPVDIMRRIRFFLKQHRKQLQVSINGVDMIPAAQGNNTGTVDAMNGPKVQACQFFQLTNTSFLLNFRVVAHYWENLGEFPEPGDPNKLGNNVLYNRWSESVEIDGCNYSKYTRDGVYRIRSDNALGKSADQVREDMAVLGVLNGCLRESSTFSVSPDGLECRYRVMDREVFKKPPDPAFEADGDYIESTNRGMGVRYGEVRVMLRGSKTTSQARLINVAIAVATSILFKRGQVLASTPKGNFSLIELARLRRSLYRNEVEFHIRAMITVAAKTAVNGIAAFKNMNTSTPLSDGVIYTPPYTSRGTLGKPEGGLLLHAAAYWDPNLVGTIIDNTNNQLTAGLEPGQAGLIPED